MSYQMATRNYYSEEQKTFHEAYGIEVSDLIASTIVRRLSKHYGIIAPRIKFWGYRQSGCARSGSIRLSHDSSIGLIMHEFTHYAKSAIVRHHNITIQNVGTTHHGLIFQACLNWVNIYAKSRNYWGNMRDAEKKARINEDSKTGVTMETGVTDIAATPGTTPGQVKQQAIAAKEAELVNAEKRLAGYKKRLQYYTKLYTTKIKKANRSIGAHKRYLKKILDKPVECGSMVANQEISS